MPFSKNILITGASSGIGKNTAILLAKNGFKVFAGVRAESAFNELKEIENITPVYLDVLDKKSIEKASNDLKEKGVELFALINNAGGVVAQPIECINIEDLKYQFELNTIAPVAVAQAFIPLLTDMRGAKIINISSMASTGIFPFISPYCASKRAMDILFNSLSIEFKNKNIKIVSIKPGSIKTPIWNKSIAKNMASLETVNEEFKSKYAHEMEFLAKNAEKNNHKALDVNKVSEKILKVLNAKNPKSSYTIGFDSFMACLVSKLPQDLLNCVIKSQLKKKLKA